MTTITEKARRFSDKVFGTQKPEAPKIDLIAEPGDFSIGVAKTSPDRHIGRLSRLYVVRKRKPDNLAEINAEIAGHKKALKELGFDPPDTEGECLQMMVTPGEQK
jgi:hypothetical protein